MTEIKHHGEREAQPVGVNRPEPEPSTTQVDFKFNQSMAEMWGDIRKSYSYDTESQEAGIDDFLSEQQNKFRQLGSAHKVEEIHRFHDLEEYADGLPMLTMHMGFATTQEREGYQNLPEDLRKQSEEKDRRNKQLFLDTARKLFPEVQPPKSLADANAEMQKISDMTDNIQEVYHAKAAADELKDPSISLKRRLDILNSTIETIGRVQESNANYGQVDSRRQPFGVSDKKRAIEATRLAYRLILVRDQCNKELYDSQYVVLASDAKQIDNIRTKVSTTVGDSAATRASGSSGVMIKETTALEGSSDLSEASLRNKRFNLGKDGPIAELYSARANTVAEVRRIVTPEMKRILLEKMLQDVDISIQQAVRILKNQPADSILGRKGVAQFCGIGVAGGEIAAAYQKIAAAAEGRVRTPDEIARMPMVDYLKNCFGYDLTKDKPRADMLKKYTNALT